MGRAEGRSDRVWSGIWAFLGLLTLLVVSCPGARAFDDPVGRAGRLAYVLGNVTVLNAESPGGAAAQLNMPLLEGVRVETGADGEAEVEFEDGSLVRLTPQSSLLLLRLGTTTDGRYGTELELSSGLIYADLRATSRYAYRIDAGRDVVTPLANATVRVTLDQPPASVAVLDGTVRVERAGAQGDSGFQVDVTKGESLRGEASGGGRYFLTQQIEQNSWDDWNEEREQAAANESAARTSARDGYAGDQGYGWSDLDANGTWYDTGQGRVWQPFDASLSGFDPYGYGSWVWCPGPGYVWSSGYAWGWTPFRFGRWNYWPGFGWGWRPGKPGVGVVRRPGNTINLSNVPPGYQRPLPPLPGGPVRVHPIVPVRSGPAPTGERVRAYEARQIAGETVMPLRTVGNGYTPRGGSAVGSSLRRDFPVDRVTRQPVMGAVTMPTGRRAPEAVTGAGGPAGSGAGTPAASGVSSGASGAEVRRGRTETDGDRPALGGTLTRPAYPTRGVPGGSAGSVGQDVHVHPGMRVEPANPVNGTPLAPVLGASRVTSVPNQRSVPSPPPPVRSAPLVLAPVRSAPVSVPAPAAAPVRSAPAAPASPATSQGTGTKK